MFKKILALVSVLVLLFTAGCSQENTKDRKIESENSFSSVSNKGEYTSSSIIDSTKNNTLLYDKYKNTTIQDVYNNYKNKTFKKSDLNRRLMVYADGTPAFYYTYKSSLEGVAWLDYALNRSPDPILSDKITGIWIDKDGLEVYDGICVGDNPQEIKEKFPYVNLDSGGLVVTAVEGGEISWYIAYSKYIDPAECMITAAEITYYPDSNSSTKTTNTGNTQNDNTDSTKKHTHSFGKWQPWDAMTHSRSCSCGKREYETHNFDNGTITREPTHIKEGNKNYKCVDCGAVKSEGIPKTESHQYGEWQEDYDQKYHFRYCSCGVYEKEPHSFNSGTVVKNATHMAVGTKKYICSVCGYDKEETIPMTSVHEYGAWKYYSSTEHIRNCACAKTEKQKHNYKYDSYSSTSSVSVYKCECGHSKEEKNQEPESKYVSESKYISEPSVEEKPATKSYHYSCYYAKYTVNENHTGTYSAQSVSQVESGIEAEGGIIDGSVQYYEVTTNEYKGEYFEAKSGIWVYLD